MISTRMRSFRRMRRQLQPKVTLSMILLLLTSAGRRHKHHEEWEVSRDIPHRQRYISRWLGADLGFSFNFGIIFPLLKLSLFINRHTIWMMSASKSRTTQSGSPRGFSVTFIRRNLCDTMVMYNFAFSIFDHVLQPAHGSPIDP